MQIWGQDNFSIFTAQPITPEHADRFAHDEETQEQNDHVICDGDENLEERPSQQDDGRKCAAGARSLADAESPAPGAAFWYLVRGDNTCGLGTWGAMSDGAPRQGATCAP